ncbi:NMT1/THI5 like domain protein (plasmid) [Rhizobium leguminosarum bv. trifolii WSM2304]|uniref:NMT1/THI5 like domain protein n=1 Tax=Rhizobium leguminosarum bv. trifolii (strain WSM2304) TaxID=395492 RepID=A0ABF7QVL7_RHILW|nr:ABC transporter substrate-binding protein [Rhizobium leguminosarum]ACI58227.1 NMT1/THI5 like domain protein [Rhizobium leguminosarum bv. trifolii WSM2304]
MTNISRRNMLALMGGTLAAPYIITSKASAAASAAEPGIFKMSIQPWIGYGMWYVAQEKGIFAANGLEGVEFIPFTEDAANLAILASGEIQATNSATHNVLQHLQESPDYHIALIEDYSTTADAIVSAKTVNSVADLKGKSIAFEEGTTSHLLIADALKKAGMKLSDLNWTKTPASQAAAALLSGSTDAMVTYEPYVSTALKADPSLKLLYTAAESPGLISDCFVVTTRTLKERPGQVRAMVKSWGDAVDLYNKNPQECQAIIAKGVGSDPSELGSTFEGVHYYTLAENKALLSGEYAAKTFPAVNAASLELGLIKKAFEAKDVIDTTALSSL